MQGATFINLLKARGQKGSELAKELKVNKASISHWNKNGVPPHRVMEVERITGIPRHEIRPDLYPVEREAAE